MPTRPPDTTTRVSRRAEDAEEDPEPWNMRKRSTSPRRGASDKPTLDRKAELAKVFGTFDMDGSGTVEAKELMALGTARQTLGHKKRVWTEERNARMIANMDKGSKDGKIDEEEFVAYFLKSLRLNDDGEFMETMEQFKACAPTKKVIKKGGRLSKADNRIIRTIFNALDTDHSEYVSVEELGRIEHTGVLVEKLDGDADGMIRLEELLFFFVNMLHEEGQEAMEVFLYRMADQLGVSHDTPSPMSPRRAKKLAKAAKAAGTEEELEEACAYAPGSPTGSQGTDLVAAKLARQKASANDTSDHSMHIKKVYSHFPTSSAGLVAGLVDKRVLLDELETLAQIDAETGGAIPSSDHQRIQRAVSSIQGSKTFWANSFFSRPEANVLRPG